MKESVIACILLTVIIGLGIFVRTSSTAEPMWLDECHTAWAVDSDSLSVVASRAADGNQPPLYFFLVWAATQVLGLSEFSLRLVSLVAGSAMMIVASLWAKTITNRWSAAILVAGLIAFDGQFIFYATEARSYALLQLIGLIQAIFFGKILASWNEHGKHKSEARARESSFRPPLIAFSTWTILSIAVLYCHYTGVWLLIAEAIAVGALAVIHRTFPAHFFGAGTAIAAAMFPTWWNVATVFDRRENWSTVSSNMQLWIDVEPWLVHWILIPIGFASAAWLIGSIQPNKGRSADKPTDSIFWSWIGMWAIIGPIGIATAALLGVAPMALVRYSIVCWVAMAIFATLPLKFTSVRISWIVAAVILGSSFYGNWWAQELRSFNQLPIFRDEDWGTTASALADSNSSEPVFQLADVIEDIDALAIDDARFQQYLLFPLRGAEAMQGDHRQPQVIVLPTLNPHFTTEHLASIRDAKGCWLIVRGNLEYALSIPGLLEKYLSEPIEFKFIPNEQMPESRVHLIRVRLNRENLNHG